MQQQPEASEQNYDESNKVQGVGCRSYMAALEPGQTRLCKDPWTFAQVLGNGLVRPCCFSGVVLGYVTDEVSFGEIYNGETAQRLRRELLTGELDEYCRICNIKPVVPTETLHKELTALYGKTVSSGSLINTKVVTLADIRRKVSPYVRLVRQFYRAAKLIGK